MCALLTGCSDSAEPAASQQVTANFLPDATALPAASATASDEPQIQFAIETTEAPLAAIADATVTPNPDILAAVEDATATPAPTATIEPTPEIETTASPSPTPATVYANYNYTALTDTSFGFVLAYPTTWQNLPGKYTVCFQEQVPEGDFPARVAVTSKKLPHKPESETIVKQFQLYAQQIYAQYDPATFEFSDLGSGTFMGRNAYAISYLAYSGDTEVKGYMCCCAIDYTLYVYHFCSAYDDFEAMTPVMTRIRDSVSLVQ